MLLIISTKQLKEIIKMTLSSETESVLAAVNALTTQVTALVAAVGALTAPPAVDLTPVETAIKGVSDQVTALAAAIGTPAA